MAVPTSERLATAVTGTAITVSVPWAVTAPNYGVVGSGTATYTIATNGPIEEYQNFCDLLDQMVRDGRASVA